MLYKMAFMTKKYGKMMIDEGHEAELGTFGADEYSGNAYQ